MNKMDCALRAARIERYLRSELDEPEDRRNFQRILDREETLGPDTSSSEVLLWWCDEELRGLIALWLYWRYRAGECSVKVYQDALDTAWSYGSEWVVGAARDRRQLRAMFRIAEFPVADHLPEVVDIWRGTGGVTLDLARKALSWSTDRDVACWFACAYLRTRRLDALVIRATVAKTDLFVPYNARDEDEVIYFDGHHAVVDADLTDWQVAGARRTAEIWCCENTITPAEAEAIHRTGSVAMVPA